MDREFYCGECGKELTGDFTTCPECGKLEKIVDSPNICFNKKVKNNVGNLEGIGNFVRIISNIAAIVLVLFGLYISIKAETDGVLIFVFYVLYAAIAWFSGFVSSNIFYFLSNTLRCLYKQTKTSKDNKSKRTIEK